MPSLTTFQLRVIRCSFFFSFIFLSLQVLLHSYPTLVFVWREIDLFHQLDVESEILKYEGSSEDWKRKEEWVHENGVYLFKNAVTRLKLLDDGSYYDFEVDRVVEPVQQALQHTQDNQLPIILWWTPYSTHQEKIKRCTLGDCYFTQNKSFYSHAQTKAFLFYGSSFNISDLPLPRTWHHEWGLLHEESPANDAIFLYKDTIEIFNHTATFRQESSFPLTSLYIDSLSYLLKPPKYTVVEKDEMKLQTNRASIAYIQSNCHPASDREVYIKELMKYINIDSYGQCLQNKELPHKYKGPSSLFEIGFTDYIAKYKFIISFENFLCKDYMTEKLFRTLSIGAVPIYKGASNVREWLPDEHSAIIVDDFSSPKELADYVTFVDENPEEYEKYMKYKQTGITNPLLLTTLKGRTWGVHNDYMMDHVLGFECHVCDRIHENKKLYVERKMMIERKATFDHYRCPLHRKYNISSTSVEDEEQRNIWMWEYENAAKRVQTLKNLLKIKSSTKWLPRHNSLPDNSPQTIPSGQFPPVTISS